MQGLYREFKDADPAKDPAREYRPGQPPTETPYEWDLARRTWFPKITVGFTAKYQASYGFCNEGAPSSATDAQDGSGGAPAEKP